MITNEINIFIEFVNYIYFFIGFIVNKKCMCGGIFFLLCGYIIIFKFHIAPHYIDQRLDTYGTLQRSYLEFQSSFPQNYEKPRLCVHVLATTRFPSGRQTYALFYNFLTISETLKFHRLFILLFNRRDILSSYVDRFCALLIYNLQFKVLTLKKVDKNNI